MPLPHNSVFQFYEGTNPTLYDLMNGPNLNQAASQLILNDLFLESEVNLLKDPQYAGLVYKVAELYNLDDVVYYQGDFYKRNGTASGVPVVPTNVTYWEGPFDIAAINEAAHWVQEPDYTTAVANVGNYLDGWRIHCDDGSADPTVNAGWSSYRVIGGALVKIQEEENLDQSIPVSSETVQGLIELATSAEILALGSGALAINPANLAAALSNASVISKTEAGYYNDPFSGLQIRWDNNISVATDTNVGIVYPLAFSNDTFVVVPSVNFNSPGDEPNRFGIHRGTESSTGFDFYVRAGGGNDNDMGYIAIGY